MYVKDVEITLREAIFSITIASILFVVGFFISNGIEHAENQRNLEYRSAVQIVNNESEFKLSMSTDVGNAFIEGGFHAVDGVRHEKLDGKWTYIQANYQKYQRHSRTETYTVTDSKGRSHTKTRTVYYWSWDTYDVKKWNSEEVMFLGVMFPFDKFDYCRCLKYTRVGNGYHKRIEFTLVPHEFHASVYADLRDGDINGSGIQLFKDRTVQQLYEDFTTSHTVAIFWTLWGMFMLFAVVVFVIWDNEWIEDNHGWRTRNE